MRLKLVEACGSKDGCVHRGIVHPSDRPVLCARRLVLPACCWRAGSGQALCGDDVDGADVPCACGDVVVSSMVLGDDPVATGAACPHDGLLIRVARPGLVAASSICRPHAARKRQGVGLRVSERRARRRPRRQQRRHRRPRRLRRRHRRRAARDSVALVEDLPSAAARATACASRRRDFVVPSRRGAHRRARRLRARRHAASRSLDTRAADCGRFGYLVMGDSGVSRSARRRQHRRTQRHAGFNLMGVGHALADCAARGGRKDGVMLQASQLDVRGCRAARQRRRRHRRAWAIAWHLADNLAVDNGGDGVPCAGRPGRRRRQPRRRQSRREPRARRGSVRHRRRAVRAVSRADAAR